MQKRAEMTSMQIGTLILAIAGFIIALIFLLVVLDINTLSQEEVCRLSVLTRATAPESLQRLAPIKCTTQKICLSESDDCLQFIGEKNIKPVTVQSEETIEAEIANAMYDCWSIMGEGKLDVFGGGTDTGILNSLSINNLFAKKTTCIICSRLALSDELQKENELLKNVDVSNYLETHQVPNSEKTYLQTFTDGQSKSYSREFREDLTNENENVPPTNEIAIIFMQINSEESPWEAGTDTAGRTGAFIFASTTGVGPLGVFSLPEGTAFSVITAVTTGSIAAIQTYRSREVSAGYCGEFTSVSESRKGCSVVVPFDYNKISEINQYCSIIEGNP
jgi:hypothetical protein